MAPILEARPVIVLISRRPRSNIPARMTPATRLLLFGAALAPYAALVGIDAWMHERARRVPRLEQALHYSAAVVLLAFLVAAFRGPGTVAMSLLALFAVITAWDELGFHRLLAARERRVHFASYAALALFVGAWRVLESA